MMKHICGDYFYHICGDCLYYRGDRYGFCYLRGGSITYFYCEACTAFKEEENNG